MIETKNIPVLLITGYLGSGKTTLLNHVLENEHGLKFAVIVNDIGEINIDADLIQHEGVVSQSDQSLVTLQNGCICCTLQNDLVEQVYHLMSLQCFDYIVIEASGICNPVPIAQTLCTIPMLGHRFNQFGRLSLDSIVTVVDALRLLDEFDGGEKLTSETIEEDDIENLLIRQIEFCNLVVLNKVSEVSEEDLKRILRMVRVLQPQAEIICCDYADVDIQKLVATRGFDFNKVSTSAGWLQQLEHHHHGSEHCPVHGEPSHHHSGGEVEEYGITTWVYYRRGPMNMEKFYDFLNQQWSKNIIRAKGICYFSSQPDLCYVFEQAGMQKDLSVLEPWCAALGETDIALAKQRNPKLADNWDEKYGDRMQKIVFIGQHLNREILERNLDACLEKE